MSLYHYHPCRHTLLKNFRCETQGYSGREDQWVFEDPTESIEHCGKVFHGFSHD